VEGQVGAHDGFPFGRKVEGQVAAAQDFEVSHHGAAYS